MSGCEFSTRSLYLDQRVVLRKLAATGLFDFDDLALTRAPPMLRVPSATRPIVAFHEYSSTAGRRSSLSHEAPGLREGGQQQRNQ